MEKKKKKCLSTDFRPTVAAAAESVYYNNVHNLLCGGELRPRYGPSAVSLFSDLIPVYRRVVLLNIYIVSELKPIRSVTRKTISPPPVAACNWYRNINSTRFRRERNNIEYIIIDPRKRVYVYCTRVYRLYMCIRAGRDEIEYSNNILYLVRARTILKYIVRNRNVSY